MALICDGMCNHGVVWLGHALAVLRPVESDPLLLGPDAHREDPVSDLVEDERAAEREGPDDEDRGEVMEEGRGAPVDDPYLVGEDAGGHDAHDAADAVAGEDVEGVVDPRLRREARRGVADHPGHRADREALLNI